MARWKTTEGTMSFEQPDLAGSAGPAPSSPHTLRNIKPSTIRVLLVDDHAMLRQSLRRVVDGYPPLEVVGEASNGLEAIEAVRLLRPDVVLMDITMPTMNGIEATSRASSRTRPLLKESAVATLCRAIEDAVSKK